MTQNDAAGQRFSRLRHWLDVSHRAIGRLASSDGVSVHESIWGAWEQRPALTGDLSLIEGVLHAIAKRLEGDEEKLFQTMYGFVKGEHALPKKPAVWKEGAKPILRRGRKPGSKNKTAEPADLVVHDGENQRGVVIPPQAVVLATDIVVESMGQNAPPLTEKVKELLRTILHSSARAVPVLVLFWLTLVAAPASASAAEPHARDSPESRMCSRVCASIIRLADHRGKRRRKRRVGT